MERILDRDEKAFKNLEAVAGLLEALSVKGYHYFVSECYLDYGQDWKWTTIICRDFSKKPTDVLASWQVLNPRQWKDIELATTLEDFDRIVKDIIGEYHNDRF